MTNLSGQHILITGASSGIGKSVAEYLAKYGANLTITGRDEKRLTETYESLDGDRHFIVPIDLTKSKELEETLISPAVQRLGKISGLVHCAGIDKLLPFTLSSKDEFRKVFDINVFSAFELTRLVSKKKYYLSDGLSIIFVSSVTSLSGEIGKVIYSSSKAAINIGIKSLAAELAKKNIRVNAILPGIVETELMKNLFDQLPQEKVESIKNKHLLGLGKPNDISPLIMYLLSQDSKWMTGTEIVIDGGYTLT